MRWHCPSDTGFEIRFLAVWGRARYLSVTEAPHNTDFHTWMGEKQFLFLSNRTPNFGVKGSGAYYYPRAPPPYSSRNWPKCTCSWSQVTKFISCWIGLAGRWIWLQCDCAFENMYIYGNSPNILIYHQTWITTTIPAWIWMNITQFY